MDLTQYEKLRGKYGSDSFEVNNRATERTFFYGSLFGNLASVFFAFFFVSQIAKSIQQMIPYQDYVFPALVIVFLIIFELLKRFVFRHMVLNFLTNRISIKSFASIIFALILVAGSFYLSVNGARNLVDNTEQVLIQADSTLNNKADRVHAKYDMQIARLNKQIDFSFANAAARESNLGLGPRETEDVIRWEAAIEKLEIERNEKIAAIQTKIREQNKTEFIKIQDNRVAFLIVSSFIELLILVGVGYGAYYWHRSFSQKQDKLSKDPNYIRFQVYDKLLRVMYQNGNKNAGDDLPTNSQFKELVLVNSVRATHREIQQFITLVSQLDITAVVSNKRSASLSYEDAVEKLRDYFVISE